MEDRGQDLELEIAAKLANQVAAELVEWGVGAVQEESTRGGRVRLRFHAASRDVEMRVRRYVQELADRVGESIDVQVRAEPDDAWRTAWVAHLVPVQLTDRVVVVPGTGSEVPGALVLEPELAFGFGDHPTTCLAARATAWLVEEQGLRSVLDVGCGTGVLALTAALHGATECLGVDIDAAAVASASRNAEQNALSDKCRFLAVPLAQLQAQYDVVVANIERQILLPMAEDIAARAGSGGKLVLAGFLEEDREDVLTCFGACGFQLEELTVAEDWLCLILSRTPLSELKESE